ncbi:hypothetical protein MTR67_025682 [Solanum verrucosum]|uniref:RING-type domain-containing protein n=1 Tax=Solanum verrucosum TaxID=315347 RepID=A0AAF0R1H1_SOLVR|nr:hypothetical protein MTR67_025682 [Solanum verrucosum]
MKLPIIENNNGYKSGDDDIELQKFLFYSAQFHSGKNLKSSSNNSEKPIEVEYSVILDSLNLKNCITEKGESSCTFCEICKNVFSLPNTIMWGTICNHRYCEECIQNYIVRDVNRLTNVLPLPLIIDCPFMDCMGKLIDNQRGYPIRACPKCWKLFCVNCKSLHFGMTCENYQFSRQLNLLYWQQQYGGYRDELEEEEEEEEEGGKEEETS